MPEMTPSDLKTVLHSKRANLYCLEHCRVLVKDGRVEYVTEEGKRSLYWNVPIANTTALLLGTGTSITQAAMRELSKAGVLVGFSGGGGTPLFSANEIDTEICWFLPQCEYRPTEFLQAWVSMWFDEQKRLEAARAFQRARVSQVRLHWLSHTYFSKSVFHAPEDLLSSALSIAEANIEKSINTEALLTGEGRLTKSLYRLVANAVGYGDFTRAKRAAGTDPANRFLDQGNYLAYGLGATATWVLGLPHGLPVLHGKTRRGGLVFDVADLVKDAVILPQAFISAMNGEDEREFRQACIDNLTRCECLDYMIDTVKDIALGMKARQV
jgi:CRISP-associated protein Cas1